MATNPTISDVCYQRKQRMSLFTVAPTRFTPISPYPQYKQYDLDMRRKAEVLSYNAAKSNTKTNNYTKAEKYALFVKGVNQSGSYATLVYPTATTVFSEGNDFLGTVDTSYTVFASYIKKATAQDCSNLDMIPTPTSSSDVPGPIQYLYRDLTLPLYNYATNQNSYSSGTVTSTDMWVTNADKMQNIFCNGLGLDTLLFTIGILNPIDKPSYNFTVEMPIALTYSAIVSHNTNPVDISNISLTVSSTTTNAKVLYSQQQVQYISPVCTFSNNNILFDVSFVPISTGNTPVFITYYIGTLTISNLNLFTSPGFIYDIQLNCLVKKEIPNNTNNTNNSIKNEKYGLICNYQGSTTPNVQYCVLKPSPTSTLTTFTVGGL
jgi:hypothetical protein